MIDAGADVVTGVRRTRRRPSRSRNGRLILYGLGNLYFDQTWSWPTRTGLVPRHTIYDGKLINTELLVTVIDKNLQLRWATPEERIQVLKSVFDVSRWIGIVLDGSAGMSRQLRLAGGVEVLKRFLTARKRNCSRPSAAS